MKEPKYRVSILVYDGRKKSTSLSFEFIMLKGPSMYFKNYYANNFATHKAADKKIQDTGEHFNLPGQRYETYGYRKGFCQKWFSQL